MKKNSSSIVIVADKSAIWDTLTIPELVKQWQYGSEVITTWVVGESIRFKTQWNDTIFEQWGTVLEVQPFSRLSYSLFAPRPGLEDKLENYFVMTYLLKDTGDGVELVIEQEDPRIANVQDNDEDEAGRAVLQQLKSVAESYNSK